MAQLIPKEELFERISGLLNARYSDPLKACLLNETEDVSRSQNAKNWMSWVDCQSQLRSVSSKIPAGILPSHLTGELTDVKVHSKGPDDKIYDHNPNFRKRVARGNCVLQLQNSETVESSTDCVIFALKKFTGGLGDDDDRDIDDGFKWQKYFTKPITETERVICTRKINGEAAHFAVRWIENDFYVVAGSKNVHLLFRTHEEVALYSEPRYLVARQVATTCFDIFQTMDVAARSVLFSFFHHTKFTAVLEILLPTYQHIENLSHLSSPQLFFISWSKTDLATGDYEEEVCIPPDFGQDLAKSMKLGVTGYDVVLHKDLSTKLTEIRKGHGYEGAVLYFVDADDKVIGMLKKKTVWYIIVRAIREKSKHATAKFKKASDGHYDLVESVTKTKKRLREIQRWLGLDDEATKAWEKLAVGFLGWLGDALKRTTVDSKDIFGLFPVVWTKYLKEIDGTDAIGLSTVTLADDPNKSENIVDND